MNQEQARFNMIEQQIRPWNVLDTKILELLSEIKRENFVPLKYQDLAFADIEIPLKDTKAGQVMQAPRVQARLVQDLNLKGGETVLHIGTGSGYTAALLSRLAKKIISLEIDPALAQIAQENIKKAGIENIEIINADASTYNFGQNQNFEAILLSGSVPSVPDSLLKLLAPKGRLIAITGFEPIMRATLIQRNDLLLQTSQPWDANTPRLQNYPEPNTFKL